MINDKLLNPRSIAVIGASNNLHKPGGKILKNILDGDFKGELCPVNPKEKEIQGLVCYRDISDLPDVDLAVLAIAANYCVGVVKQLAKEKGTKAFVIISAGFSEEGERGAEIERELVAEINKVNGALIGPNCIGFINHVHHSIFTSPIPDIDPGGCDLISGSGATAVFILESGMPKGLKFASIWSVGNSAQIGVEEVIEYMDNTFDKEKDSKIKLLYIETIRDPDKLLKHASSLIGKGCKIAAIKAGGSDAGSRAAASHTGALAGSDQAVEALFRKAGIVRCYSREEITTVASIFTHKTIKGKNVAIITHAGGPGVMLTDTLEAGGLKIPKIKSEQEKEIQTFLHHGSSASNPIDLLATGTAEQLGKVIDYCEEKLDFIDAILVIFGSAGLFDVFDVYEILHEKTTVCKKPIYSVLPSISSAKKEVEFFLAKGHVNFPDEVMLGEAIVKVNNTPHPASQRMNTDGINVDEIRSIIESATDGFQPPDIVRKLFNAASIPVVQQIVVKNKRQLLSAVKGMDYPLALKVIGPVHKTEVGGVVLNIKTELHLVSEFKRLMKIKEAQGVLVQPMLSGIELFIGAKYEPKFGHVILFGLGGIFIEVLKDVSSGLAPLSLNEAKSMIKSVKSYKIIKGYRGKPGINEKSVIQILIRLSALLRHATEIKELDINPLIGINDDMAIVDSRILIQK